MADNDERLDLLSLYTFWGSDSSMADNDDEGWKSQRRGSEVQIPLWPIMTLPSPRSPLMLCSVQIPLWPIMTANLFASHLPTFGFRFLYGR